MEVLKNHRSVPSLITTDIHSFFPLSLTFYPFLSSLLFLPHSVIKNMDMEQLLLGRKEEVRNVEEKEKKKMVKKRKKRRRMRKERSYTLSTVESNVLTEKIESSKRKNRRGKILFQEIVQDRMWKELNCSQSCDKKCILLSWGWKRAKKRKKWKFTWK